MAAQERIGELVENYGDMVLRLAYTYMKNMPDAEDVSQDVFMKLIEKLPEFNDPGHERAWIIRVTINICKNKLRAIRIRRFERIEDMDIPVFDRYSDNSDVFAKVMALPEKYRTAIHLYYYEGYTTPEIAQMTGRKEASIRSDLHRARKILKADMEDEDILCSAERR